MILPNSSALVKTPTIARPAVGMGELYANEHKYG